MREQMKEDLAGGEDEAPGEEQFGPSGEDGAEETAPLAEGEMAPEPVSMESKELAPQEGEEDGKLAMAPEDLDALEAPEGIFDGEPDADEGNLLEAQEEAAEGEPKLEAPEELPPTDGEAEGEAAPEAEGEPAPEVETSPAAVAVEDSSPIKDAPAELEEALAAGREGEPQPEPEPEPEPEPQPEQELATEAPPEEPQPEADGEQPPPAEPEAALDAEAPPPEDATAAEGADGAAEAPPPAEEAGAGEQPPEENAE